jgi:hypothetical protein
MIPTGFDILRSLFSHASRVEDWTATHHVCFSSGEAFTSRIHTNKAGTAACVNTEADSIEVEEIGQTIGEYTSTSTCGGVSGLIVNVS